MKLEKISQAPDYPFWIIIALIVGLLFPFYSLPLIIPLTLLGGFSMIFGIGLKRSFLLLFGLIIFASLAGLLRSPDGFPLKHEFSSADEPQHLSRVHGLASRSITTLFPQEKSEILQAMLLGDTQKLSWNRKVSLNKSGLRHITAISGMHIATIYILLALFFVGIGFWRQYALLASTVIMILYILLIGAPPSAVRALVMGILAVFAELLGRPGNAARFLLFAAGIMLFINPSIIWSIGFQLSFSAVLGIIYLSPIIKHKLEVFPDIAGIQTLISVSLSAQLSVFPLLLFYFGEASIIGIFINIIVVPALPLLLIIAFFAVILGIFSPLLGIIFSLPASLLLSGMITLMDIAATQRFSTIALPDFHWAFIAPYYLILLLTVFHMKRSK